MNSVVSRVAAIRAAVNNLFDVAKRGDVAGLDDGVKSLGSMGFKLCEYAVTSFTAIAASTLVQSNLSKVSIVLSDRVNAAPVYNGNYYSTPESLVFAAMYASIDTGKKAGFDLPLLYSTNVDRLIGNPELIQPLLAEAQHLKDVASDAERELVFHLGDESYGLQLSRAVLQTAPLE